MPVVLVADPASPSANAYVDVAEADAYLATQLYADAWATTDPDLKARALITATRLLDEQVTWRGNPVSTSQALGLPRSSLPVKSGWGFLATSVIPAAVKQATADLARRLVEAEQLPDAPSDTAGLKKLKAGPVELEFDGSTTVVGSVIPDAVFAQIAFLVEGSATARTCVPLTRA